MIEKVILILIGTLVKTLYDQISNISKGVESRISSIAEYRPNPAVQKGSAEEHHLMAKLKYQQMVEPQVKKLKRWVVFWKCVPAVIISITIGLLLWLTT